ncbi:MAG: divergent polysaccharide deacetylase family protein [Candidatus Neomarinimicrobiota bacterium]
MKNLNFKRISIILAGLVVILAVTQLITLKELKKKEISEIPEEVIIPKRDEEAPAAKLVLVIDDFGYRNDEVSDRFLKLNIPLTCAIIPGHAYSVHFARLAVKAGKEVIVHMPMESTVPTHGEEEYILKTKMTSQEIESRVQKVLQHIPQAVGMNNHQGSKATANKRIMAVLGTVLKESGKFFIDSRTTVETVAESTLRSLGVNTWRRTVFLDNDADPALIRSQIEEWAAKARKDGMALGIGHAKLSTLLVLEKMIPNLIADGFEFEFASTILNRKNDDP